MVETIKSNKIRAEKQPLDSRVFRDGQIYLFRRADYKKPTWFCRVKIPNAKGYVTVSTRTTDEHAAYKFADDLFHKTLVKVANGQEINSKRVDIAIKEFIASFSPHDLKRSSVSYRVKYLENLVPFFKNIRLKEINTVTLSELNRWCRENSRSGDLSSNTLRRYSTDLKQFFNWCLDQNYLEIQPRFPKIRTENNRRPHFDNQDYNKLTRHLREYVKSPYPWVVRDRTMLVNYVLILANTGIRVGEARTLKWSDLKEITPKKGSNAQSEVALFVSGKTGSREVVARTAEVKKYFQRILELRQNELKETPRPDDYIFCNRDGSPIGSFKKSFSSLLKSAGVEKDKDGNQRTIYSLRHTYATFRLQEGVHQFILAKNMGTSTAMLERHYGHTSNIASAEELTKGGAFKGGKNKATSIDWLMGISRTGAKL